MRFGKCVNCSAMYSIIIYMGGAQRCAVLWCDNVFTLPRLADPLLYYCYTIQGRLCAGAGLYIARTIIGALSSPMRMALKKAAVKVYGCEHHDDDHDDDDDGVHRDGATPLSLNQHLYKTTPRTLSSRRRCRQNAEARIAIYYYNNARLFTDV